jgi:hypothetical protein
MGTAVTCKGPSWSRSDRTRRSDIAERLEERCECRFVRVFDGERQVMLYQQPSHLPTSTSWAPMKSTNGAV